MKEKEEPIRILQCVNDMHRAGLETMLMNYYRNIDRDKIQFDFLTHRPYKSDYDGEIIKLGGRVYYAPRLYPQNYPKYFKWMKEFFLEHPEYKIVHSHIDAMSYIPLLAAKKNNIPIRIAHSHSTSIDKDFKYLLKQYYRMKINKVSTHNLACGYEAGKFLFKGRKFKIISNAVDASKFYYVEKIRKLKRKELNIDDEFVVGHIGRICYPKNHKFLIDIFEEIIRIYSKSKLLIVGMGEKEEEIKEYVKSKSLEEKIKFLGSRNDVSELYQAMDVFVLPSLFEGIPLVGIEAQFSDLPCFFSDRVPKEAKFNEKTKFVSLDNSPFEWAQEIIKVKDLKRVNKRNDAIDNNYDIKNTHKVLENFYFDLYKSIMEDK
ncbi:MAG: glycosyltransferase family 1 protein [Clostridia bacterium]|nr:glycosyltransferase family 1 protein [Clostridia bacterium]